MTDEALQQIWKSYQDAWSDVPAERSAELLRATLSDDIAFSNPDSEGRGIEDMIAHVQEFQKQYPGCYFRSTLLRQQHGQLLAPWTLFDRNDAPLVNGFSYGRFNEETNRFTQLAGFWKL